MEAFSKSGRSGVPGRSGWHLDRQKEGEGDGNPDFERIRRITGYLVGTLDHFNNGKRAEERDRVKHSLTDGDLEQL